METTLSRVTIQDERAQLRIAKARRELIRRRRRELERNPSVQKWKRMTKEERAKSIIELMTKNHMEHARLLGRFESEEKLRAKLAALAMTEDNFGRKE